MASFRVCTAVTAARTAPSVERNREPILEVLRDSLPPAARVLEIASGTGEHAVFFASAMPDVQWQPTDRSAEALASIAAWRESGPTNMLPPLPLDASDPVSWPVAEIDAVVSINMVHISPWAATQGLMAGAAGLLPADGVLVLYGPFREGGAFVGGNAAFDADLRARDPAWGVRDIEAVVAEAGQHGLVLRQQITMPAHNLLLVFGPTA